MVHGPVTHQFEDAFKSMVGGGHCVSVSSCTAGLHLASIVLRLGPGDEVIVPAQTHVATAHGVEFVGAKPIFVDCEIETGNIDLDLVEKAIGPHTKAISIVHYLGFPVDMARLKSLASAHDLAIIEDAALAIGTRYDGIHAGLMGDLGAFSFYPVKHITTAEGGVVTTQNEEIAREIALIRAFGVDRTYGERKIPGVYDTVALGFNYRMNEIEAAMGVEQLKRVDGFLKLRARNFAALEEGLASVDGLSFLRKAEPPFTHSHYCFQTLLDPKIAPRRPEIIEAFKAVGIGTSVYYPAPVPRMHYYREKYGYNEDLYPNATRMSDHSIALPVGPHVGLDDLDYIIEKTRMIMADFSS